MKIKLPHYFLGLFAVCAFQAASAQDYENLTVSSGYNGDVIANGVGAATTSTSTDVDGVNYAFVSNDFQATSSSTAPAYGLNTSGLITSAATTGLTYQLADFSENNSLRMPGSPGVSSGTMEFTNQVSATKLFVLATSGSGSAVMTSTINFTDGTTQEVTGSNVPDSVQQYCTTGGGIRFWTYKP